ncbi:hypothetical protein MRX96_038414 [Rhipicephalus microplus]
MFWFSASQKEEEAESPLWWTSSLLTGPLVEAYEQLDTWCLGCDHFERSVAQALLVVFAINVVLILCVWRRCGDQIADQFLNLGELTDCGDSSHGSKASLLNGIRERSAACRWAGSVRSASQVKCQVFSL